MIFKNFKKGNAAFELCQRVNINNGNDTTLSFCLSKSPTFSTIISHPKCRFNPNCIGCTTSPSPFLKIFAQLASPLPKFPSGTATPIPAVTLVDSFTADIDVTSARFDRPPTEPNVKIRPPNFSITG